MGSADSVTQFPRTGDIRGTAFTRMLVTHTTGTAQ
jgi:hypothetical protein